METIPENRATNNRPLLQRYAAQGWKLKPVHKKTRHPHYNEWQKTDFSIDLILYDMAQGHGVGIQTGPASNHLVCVDNDSHYARVCAPDFLPRTLWTGKENERGGLLSHALYYSPGAKKITVKPLDTEADKGAVVELLGAPEGQGRQFIVPPSTHPKKGAYVWDGGFDPDRIATIDAEDLQRRVRHLGVAALIAEHMPESGRHDFSLALAGLMLRDDREDLETVEAILESAWNAVDGDAEAAVKNARDTAETLNKGGKVKGGKEVNKIVKGLAGRIADALGWEERDRPLTEEEQQALVQAAADKAWADPRVRSLARAENILNELYNRVRDAGLVGEQTNAELLLLAGVSLCRGNPISAIVKGTSSVGKSETIKAVSRAFPPEMVIEKQSMSDKYLAYAGENGELKNKLLVVYELGGFGAEGSEGLEMAKQLMSEGRISRGTVDKGDGKQNVARDIVTEGPTALWTTTTKVKTDYELGNRVFELTPDDGRDQTRAINELVFDYDADEIEHDFSDAHGLFRWLLAQEHRVYFPYGKALGQLIPNDAVKMRREAKRIRYLIDAHAMLHQQSRERDERGRILANLDDYEAVKRLVESFVGESSELGVKPEVRETVMAAERIMNPEEGTYEHSGVTVKEIEAELKLDNASANRRLRGASPYLVRLEDKRKNAYQFGRSETLPEANNVLPTREQLGAHHATFALLHGDSDPQGSPNGNGSVSIQNDAKVRAKFAQKSDAFVPSDNGKSHRNGESCEGDTTLEGNSAWGSIGVQKCKSPESEDSDEATFVQKSGTFAEAHAKVEDGDDPKAEPPTRGRESGEQLASVRELVRQGMSPTWARAEVLGPISAQPEEGEREVTPENLDEYMEQNRARMPNPPAPGQKRFEPGGRYDQMVPVVQLYYQQERRKGANHLDALALAIKFEEALEAARVEQEAREAACAHENTRRSDWDGVLWCTDCGWEEDEDA